MLQLSGVSKAYGGQVVLADVTWTVAPGTRVGLAGPNGAGKSTLLRLVAGEIEPDRGVVTMPRGTRVGYLPQHILGGAGTTVLAHALSAFAELYALEARRADLEARNWLEEFLASYPGTVILVAHDRYFLDVAVERTAEVLNGRVTDYPMPYSRYLEEREKRLELARAAYAQQQEEIARIEAFISRFRYQASKAALVQSRIKQLERIERLPPPDGHERTLRIRLPEAARSGRTVLELRGARKRYGDVAVYDGVDVLIERGQRVALVGPNGAGKTTLLKLLAGVLPLDGGERKVGQNVQLAYFAQDHGEMLDAERTVLEEVLRVATVETAPHVRALLGAFLFSGDAVDKRVGVLSGGERSRLALAKLLLQPANCLLLDEPTNHLDLTAKEVLLEALLAYQGTIVIVAHDRYILDRLPTQVIEVGGGRAVRYLGNYEDWVRAKARATAPAQEPVERRRARS